MTSRISQLRIAAVVLAAGGSSRFGSPKQLHPHRGIPLIRHAAIEAKYVGADPIIVVLGADAQIVAKAVEDVPRVVIIVNQEWSTGLSSSLRIGLKAVPGGCDGVLVTLADQPLVGRRSLRKLTSEFHAGARIVASKYANTIGVPAMFGKEFIDELCTLSRDAGAGKWLRNRRSGVTLIELDAAEIDIDTPEDALRLEER